MTAGRVVSIGLLTPHAAPGPEAELPPMAPGRVVTRVSRILPPGADPSAPGPPPASPSGLRTLAVPAALDEAAAAFARGSVDVLGYASTSTGYALGFDAENAMLERLSRRWGLLVAGTSQAAGAALRAVEAERVALVHPPWFDDELRSLGTAYFRSQGFEVASSAAADLPNDPRRIEPAAVIEWICRHMGDDADAVFIGGTGFRAAQAVDALEERLGRPVLESNQVLLWSILMRMQADIEVVGYGQLFDRR